MDNYVVSSGSGFWSGVAWSNDPKRYSFLSDARSAQVHAKMSGARYVVVIKNLGYKV